MPRFFSFCLLFSLLLIITYVPSPNSELTVRPSSARAKCALSHMSYPTPSSPRGPFFFFRPSQKLVLGRLIF
ncbi:hypothetical protein F5X96DRAFT_651414 [Biscogniauxia mediterranea]|nr:hypothetical protein F5X96DRAFT_651414 [Biscogniauxia mediterranea]